MGESEQTLKNVLPVVKDQFQETKQSRQTIRFAIPWTLWDMIKVSKSPWYYWYRDSKFVAIQAWCGSAAIMFVLAMIVTGGSFVKATVYVLIGVALENVAILVLGLLWVIDVFVISIPGNLYHSLVFPIIISATFAFVLNRLVVFIVIHSKLLINGNEIPPER